MLKIGILSSSGGSAFFKAREILHRAWGDKAPKFLVVTDRECETEQKCAKAGIAYCRANGTNEEISRQAFKFFQDNGGVDFCVLFFLKLVTPELYKKIATFNIHPSLLPDYPGFKSIERAFADGSRVLGCTLHLADESIDGGKIIFQTSRPITPEDNIDRLYKYSYLQKVYLFLLLIDLYSKSSPDISSLSAKRSPELSDPGLGAEFHSFQKKEGFFVCE